MNDYYVQITFSVTKTTGVFSFLMMNASKFGLMYNKKFENDLDDNISEVVVYFTGDKDIPHEELVLSFEKHPSVYRVQSVKIVSITDQIKNHLPDEEADLVALPRKPKKSLFRLFRD